jgi:hypothetical protein
VPVLRVRAEEVKLSSALVHDVQLTQIDDAVDRFSDVVQIPVTHLSETCEEFLTLDRYAASGSSEELVNTTRKCLRKGFQKIFELIALSEADRRQSEITDVVRDAVTLTQPDRTRVEVAIVKVRRIARVSDYCDPLDVWLAEEADPGLPPAD